ncbi:hypothetical protein L1987_45148 [Smallanthus sonchifolius]|uniref:Uncharacterized protein n=1 Tax=Smallanthus sonchifolius TaxID=185202 RepID=A0ACB9GS33_9ASTR|nr:hypothetical protein L1987_45148 [Smallanthus sonchifolius]
MLGFRSIKDYTSTFREISREKEKNSKMKFGKRFRKKISIIMPDWEHECMSYKDLKKQLNLMDPDSRDEGFKRLLRNQLVKLNDFFSKKEEEYNNIFQELKRELADLDSDEDATQVTVALLQFHNKLVLLLHYHELNFDVLIVKAGFLKIIKKHRKKTGELFSLSFMQGDNKKLVFIANSLDKLLAECVETLRLLSQNMLGWRLEIVFLGRLLIKCRDDSKRKQGQCDRFDFLFRRKMMKAVCLVMLCLFALISISSQSRSLIQKPQPNPNFHINSTDHQNARTCSFTVRITTSCSSTLYTRDQISVSFGDAYGNQVYAPRIDDPSTRTFERCSADTFEIYGPCTYQICYLYLYRSGYDGWMPERVDVYGYNTRAASFYFNVWIPANVWYGLDYCSPYAAHFATKQI